MSPQPSRTSPLALHGGFITACGAAVAAVAAVVVVMKLQDDLVTVELQSDASGRLSGDREPGISQSTLYPTRRYAAARQLSPEPAAGPPAERAGTTGDPW